MNRRFCFFVICLAAVVMTSCSDAVPQVENTQMSTQTPVSGNYDIVSESYVEKEITVKYPQITNLGDDSRQEKINKLIKTEAMSFFYIYDRDCEMSLDIEYQITLQSQGLLSIQYTGLANVGAAYPTDLFYTINIDIESASKLKLADFIKCDESFLEKFKNLDVGMKDELYAMGIKHILDTYTTEELIDCFEGSDSAYGDLYYTFSYLTKDAVGISLNIPHAIGDHVEIEFSYDELKDNIKTDNKAFLELID